MARFTSVCVMLVLLCSSGVVLAQEGPPSRDRERPPRQDRDWSSGKQGGRRSADHRRRSHRSSLTEEERDTLYKILEEVNPELLERLKKWQEADSPHAMSMLTKMRYRFHSLMRVKETDRAMYDLKIQDLKLEMQSQALAKEAGQSSEKRAQLKAVLREHFDVRQKIRERDMEKLRQRIAELEKQTQARSNSREQLIEARLKELSQKSQKASW